MIGRLISMEGDTKNTPAVRFGNISMLPDEPIVNRYGHPQETFLIDSRSIPGYSGSPVFLILFPPSPRPPHYYTMVDVEYDSAWHGPFLLGIDWFHPHNYEELHDEKMEPISPKKYVKASTGMAGVIPAWRLSDLINCDELKTQRAKTYQRLTRDRNIE